MQNIPKVSILLATYQGQEYLAKQLDSIETQSHKNWDLWVSDDGSYDDTHAILTDYRKKWPLGRLSIFNGPKKGSSKNFLSLICNTNISADYYAYADQDDIWETEKLARAVKALESFPAEIPALYCSRVQYVDKNNNVIGLSPLFRKPPSFENAIVQNIGGGNTMLFNNSARILLQEAGDSVPVIVHDWWTYMAVIGCGGNVFYDIEPTVRYRQHANNQIGMNSSWIMRFKRVTPLLKGQFKSWNDRNISALESIAHRLTPKNLSILNQFSEARSMPLVPRLSQLNRIGIYRQSFLGNISLFVAAFIGRL